MTREQDTHHSETQKKTLETQAGEPPKKETETENRVLASLCDNFPNGEEFSVQDPQDQARFLKELGQHYLPEGYRVELNKVRAAGEDGSGALFHEHFIYKENTKESLPADYVESDLKAVWDELLEVLELADIDSRNARVRECLQDMYREIYKGHTEVPEEWVSSFYVPIVGCADANPNFEKRNSYLERHFDEFLRQGVEARRMLMRPEFKIHLNPHASAKLETVRLLMKLISEDEYIKTHLREFKVSCEKGEDQESISDFQRPPDMVIYPERAETAEESMAIVAEFIRRLRDVMAGMEDEALPISTHIPRHNFPISRMIHLAQSSGSLKDSLVWRRDAHSMEEAEDGYWCPKEGRAGEDTMISAFFDPAVNNAFFHEDSERAQSVFGTFQTEEAISYISQVKTQWASKLARAAVLRREHSKKPAPPKKGLLQRLRDFLS